MAKRGVSGAFVVVFSAATALSACGPPGGFGTGGSFDDRDVSEHGKPPDFDGGTYADSFAIAADPFEENDELAIATPLRLEIDPASDGAVLVARVVGASVHPGDRDLYVLSVDVPSDLTVRLRARDAGPDRDLEVALLDARGDVQAEPLTPPRSEPGLRVQTIEAAAVPAGVTYVRVRGRTGVEAASYQLVLRLDLPGE